MIYMKDVRLRLALAGIVIIYSDNSRETAKPVAKGVNF